MKRLIIAVIVLSATSLSALAQNQNNQGCNGNCNGNNYRGAPGPIIGAGLPLLAAGGIGYGVYWLVKRRRRAD